MLDQSGSYCLGRQPVFWLNSRDPVNCSCPPPPPAPLSLAGPAAGAGLFVMTQIRRFTPVAGG